MTHYIVQSVVVKLYERMVLPRGSIGITVVPMGNDDDMIVSWLEEVTP